MKPADQNTSQRGRRGIIREEVALALSELTVDGKGPSLRRLRHFLGTGSLTTISKFRQEIEAEQDEAESTRDPREIKVHGQIQKYLNDLHLEITQLADKREDEATKRADLGISKAESRRDKLIQKAEFLTERAMKAETTVSEQKKAYSALSEKYEALRVELESSRNKNSELEERIRNQDTYSKQLDQQVEQLQEKAAHSQIEQEKLHASHRQAIQDLNQLLREAEKMKSDAMERNSSLTIAFEGLKKRFDERIEVIADQKDQLDKLDAKNARRLTRIKELIEERDLQLAHIDTLNKANDSLQKDLHREQSAHSATKSWLEELRNHKDGEISRLQKIFDDLVSSASHGH